MSIRINSLTAKDVVSAGDQVPIFSTTDGDTRRASMTAVAAFVAGTSTAADDKVTQYAAPSSSPFTVTVPNLSNSVWLVITPTGTMALGTIVLPALGTAVDRQEVLVNTTQAVTGLTVSDSGASITGAPTTLAANAYFLLRFDAVTSTWYRVG